ncbi:MAG: hypothetical protein IT500_15660 [Rubrivivax sp.]|jgi:hypothetical protein|nr:hypothetical protein [Rubrivivax sp.]
MASPQTHRSRAAARLPSAPATVSTASAERPAGFRSVAAVRDFAPMQPRQCDFLRRLREAGL